MNYETDLANLGRLGGIAQSIVDYALSLQPGLEIVRGCGLWKVSTGFMHFEPRPRESKVWFGIRGYLREFEISTDLPLWRGAGYGCRSEFWLNSPRQLLAACEYVTTAHRCSDLGRMRLQGRRKFAA
jgi:hypothetical protein